MRDVSSVLMHMKVINAELCRKLGSGLFLSMILVTWHVNKNPSQSCCLALLLPAPAICPVLVPTNLCALKVRRAFPLVASYLLGRFGRTAYRCPNY